MKERTTPAIIYSSLKLYGIIRSETLMNHSVSLGACLSYHRVLKITKELSDTQKTLHEH